MGRILFTILLVYCATSAFAQLPITIQTDGCIPAGTQQSLIIPTSFKGTGLNLTSKGYLKILVIMAQFPDDNHDPNNQEWPLNLQGGPQPAPIWVQNPGSLFTPVADFTAQGMNPLENSISDFFYEMTQVLPENERLRIYGDVVHYVFPLTREQMRTWNPGGQNPNPGMTILEAMNIVINGIPGGPAGVQLPQGSNWNTYDVWNSPGSYGHVIATDPERFLDLVIVCWRDITRSTNLTPAQTAYLLNMNWLQPTRAHWAWNGGADIFTNDGHRIRVGFGPAQATPPNTIGQTGSTIWFSDFLAERGTRSTGVPEYYFRGLVHEIGHHLLGSHVRGSGNTLIANADHRAYTPTAYEMSELGWMTPTIIRKNTTYDQTLQLGDLLTTGDAVCIEIDETKNKWFMLENHQMINKYDFMSRGENIRNDTKGIYVMYHNNKEQRIQSASGSFDWPVVLGKQLGSQVVPVFNLGNTNTTSGYTRSEIVTISTAEQAAYHIVDNNNTAKYDHIILFTQTGSQTTPVDVNYFEAKTFAGDEHELCTTADWSSTSNPRNHWYDRTTLQAVSSETSFRLQSVDASGTYTLRIANNNKDITPPKRVDDLADIPINAGPYLGTHGPQTKIVNIAWTASVTDPDFDHYLITGGDNNVTAPTSANTQDIHISIPPNSGYVDRTVNVYTVDVSGNISCNAETGSISVRACATIETEQKRGHSTVSLEDAPTAETCVSVWPHPFMNQLNMLLTGKHHVIGVNIADEAGRLVDCKVNVTNGFYNTQIQIDPEIYSQGMLLISVHLSDGTTIKRTVLRN